MDLKSRLADLNWKYKQNLYLKYLDYVDTVKEVKDPDLSVVVISWRLHKDTLVNFKKLQEQRKTQNFELIFVNNGASEDEFKVLKPYIDVYIKLIENTGAYLARNIGAVLTKAPIILFLEDDGIPDEQLIEAHVNTHKLYDVISVVGVYLYKTLNELNELQTHYYQGDIAYPRFSDLEGNTSYKSDVFFEVGGWDDFINFGGGGKELAIRLFEKYPDYSKQMYSPYCIISHDYVANEEHLAKKREKQNASHKRLKEKYVQWSHFNEQWCPFKRQSKYLVLKSKKHLNDYKYMSKAILQRNAPKIENYMRGRLFLDELEKKNSSIIKTLQNKKIVIFGCGDFGKRVNKALIEQGIDIFYYCDNNSQIWGRKKDGIEVIPPANLTKEHSILITSLWSSEIVHQLLNLGYKAGKHFKVII